LVEIDHVIEFSFRQNFLINELYLTDTERGAKLCVF